MKESDMKHVADLLRRTHDGASSEQIRAEIKDLLMSFQGLCYSFDGADL